MVRFCMSHLVRVTFYLQCECKLYLHQTVLLLNMLVAKIKVKQFLKLKKNI